MGGPGRSVTEEERRAGGVRADWASTRGGPQGSAARPRGEAGKDREPGQGGGMKGGWAEREKNGSRTAEGRGRAT